MKFTVEVEDFYLEEGELAQELQHQLKNSVVHQIRSEIEEKVKLFMDHHIKSVINEDLQTRVQIMMENLVKTGKIKGGYSSDPDITIDQWALKQFDRYSPDIKKQVEASVSKHVKDLQNRYDLLFATQLISKIKEQGFLKEDAAKILLQES